ncbi:hypothetical protein N6L24_07890 [Cognatishimia sp. SS12]|uniref:hypothetical protein n=1 Tax=Cognatishimia sp. SS12 TaxID=2979465 RepID=UPI00232AEFFC|nr:hypothetical protein [Cognatishimia sp. SS12]MDC0738197.1 hypothetical protein [Cognatishimia sp. SS12]
MTVMQEIALRQSLMYGGLVAGLLLTLLFAALLSYRNPSWYKTLFAALPYAAYLVAGAANFGVATVLGGLALVLLGEGAAARGRMRGALIAYGLAGPLFLARFLELGAVPLPAIVFGAILAMTAVLLHVLAQRRETGVWLQISAALCQGVGQAVLLSTMGFANPLFSI